MAILSHRRRDLSSRRRSFCARAAFNWPNLIVWLLGFIAYRLLMNVDLPVGNTLPAVVITMVLCYIVNKLVPSKA